MADVGRGGVLHFDIDYSRGNRFFMGLIGMGPRFSGVEIDDEEVRVRMGWGFHTHVPLAGIRRVSATERPFFAWGAHGWRGRWLVNGSSKGIVALELDPPARGWAIGFPLRLRVVSISLADPDGFITALEPFMSDPDVRAVRAAGSSGLPS
jgi:hypothetical protein